MTDIPETVKDKCARRRLALNLIGTPIHPPLARYLDSLKSTDEGETTVVYFIETRERISCHNIDTATEFVEKLAEKRRKERESNSALGVSGRVEMQKRLENELDTDYETALRNAKSDLTEPVLEFLQYAY